MLQLRSFNDTTFAGQREMKRSSCQTTRHMQATIGLQVFDQIHCTMWDANAQRRPQRQSAEEHKQSSSRTAEAGRFEVWRTGKRKKEPYIRCPGKGGPSFQPADRCDTT